MLTAAGGVLGPEVAKYSAPSTLPEEFKRAVTPAEAITDVGIVESLQQDSVRLQLELAATAGTPS